jgi:hypothetical protein
MTHANHFCEDICKKKVKTGENTAFKRLASNPKRKLKRSGN